MGWFRKFEWNSVEFWHLDRMINKSGTANVLPFRRVAHEHHALVVRPRANLAAVGGGAAAQLLDELVAQIRPLGAHVFRFKGKAIGRNWSVIVE